MIRVAHADDAEQVRDIYRPAITDGAVTFEEAVPSISEIADRISALLPTHPWIVYEDPAGQVAGYAYACVHRTRASYRWCVEVSVYIAAGRTRTGIGRSLYTTLFDLLRRQHFYNAYAGITLPNPASVGLHESMGFQLIGVYKDVGFKMGSWHDVGWWQLRLQEPPADAVLPEPIPFREIAHAGAVLVATNGP